MDLKRILAAALMALFLTAGCSASDNSTVPASQDPSESQALSKQVKALAREIGALAQTNAELAGEVGKLSRANTRQASLTSPQEQARKAPAPTQSQDQAEPAGRGICSRTPAVQKAVIGRLGILSCSVITPEEMFRIEEGMSIESGYPFKPNDFAGMPNLKALSLDLVCLHVQGELLPAGVFQGLENLYSLQIDVEHPYCGAEEGITLPSGVFDGLTNLYRLVLPDSDLTSLPPDVFDGLANLHTLDLRNNGLTSLPPGVFDGLANLHTLDLGNNGLTSLPQDTFIGLTSLRRLELSSNHDPVTGQSKEFEIEVASIGVAAALEGSGFVIVDKQQ